MGETSLPPRVDRAAPNNEKSNKQPRGLSWFKGVIIVMIIALIALLAYAGYLYMKYRETLGEIGTEAVVKPEEKADAKPLAVLLLGVDYREELRSANTDVIMVATLNPVTKSATLVSIPRDTRIDPEGLKPNKANSFYSTYLYGRLSSAPEDKDERQNWAMEKIKEMYGDYLDIPIDYVSVVDFKTFTDVVDGYGGLTIDVDQNMCHKDNADGTHINLKEGVQHLDGKNTLDFIRYRKSQNCSPKTDESSDFERNARQQQVISKLLEKMKTPGGIANLGSVFDAVGNHVKTDIPSQQIDALIQTYISIDTDKIKYIHLEGDWDGHYVRVSDEDVENAKSDLQAQLDSAVPESGGAEAEEAAVQ
ncbi:LCP family protein [Paenibacillus alkalitolerans]|uniref:LCP family protein n=1 Tax=Paenibacillus alkalitolerans TaxID=2799335 RepID=UPI0018F3F398|nr:LCP family protein [Paenibacillus alkalitolerans]